MRIGASFRGFPGDYMSPGGIPVQCSALLAASSLDSADLRRSFFQRLGLGNTVCSPIQTRKIFKARRHIGMVGAEGLLGDLQGLLRHRHGAVWGQATVQGTQAS